MESVTDCLIQFVLDCVGFDYKAPAIRFVKETNYGVLAKLPPYSIQRSKRRPNMNRKTWRISALAHKRVRNAYTQFLPKMTIRFVEM